MDALLTLEDFLPLVGSDFRTEVPGGDAIDLRLVSATPLNPRPDAPRQPFSLIFRGPAEAQLEQKTYRMRAGSMDAVEIFIVPVGRSRDGIEYEAVFN